MVLKRSVKGSFHQGNIRQVTNPYMVQNGSNGGSQCTAMALMFLMMSSFLISPQNWSSYHVDEALNQGDLLYATIVDSSLQGDHTRCLAHHEIPQEIRLLEEKYEVGILHNQFGVVGESGNEQLLTMSLEEALQMVLTLSRFVVATFGDETIAITQDESGVHVFDSHARDEVGNIDCFGSAILLSYSSLQDVLNLINTRFSGLQFDITAFEIKLSHKLPNDEKSEGSHRGQPKQKKGCENIQEMKRSISEVDLHLLDVTSQTLKKRNVHQDINAQKKYIEKNKETPGLRLKNKKGIRSSTKTNTSFNPECAELLMKKQVATNDSEVCSSFGTLEEQYVSVSACNETNSTQVHMSKTDRDTLGDSSIVVIAEHDFLQQCKDTRVIRFLSAQEYVHLRHHWYGQQNEVNIQSQPPIHVQKLKVVLQDHNYAKCQSIDHCNLAYNHVSHDHTYSTRKMSSDSVQEESKQKVANKGVYYIPNKHKRYAAHYLSKMFNQYSIKHQNNLEVYNPTIDLCQEIEVTTLPRWDPLHSAHHILPYELAIRQKIISFCACCHRFLFLEQIYHLPTKRRNTRIDLHKLNEFDDLCSTCCTALKANHLPALSFHHNKLNPGIIPKEFYNLHKLEKKMLAKIQTFFTMVILPGGQYAERGLVLNLPVNVDVVSEELHKLNVDDNVCIVHFEKTKPTTNQLQHHIRSHLVKNALEWLQKNNHLYNKIHMRPLLPNSQETRFEDYDDIEDLEEAALIENDYCSPSQSAANIPIINIPKSDQKPVAIYDVEHGEEKAFPWLFPLGNNGFLEVRDVKIAPSMYFKSRLYHYSANWRKDISYLLHTAVSYDLMLLKKEIGIYMKMTKSVTNNLQQPVTASDVIQTQQSTDACQNSYMFMKKIRGTVAYYKNALGNLLAMLKCLGPPTLFITVSANDLKWTELGMSLEDLSYEEASAKANFFQSMRADPLLTAIHFERRFNALFKHIINSPEKPLGDVTDWFIRAEFQNRGSVHYHMFVWIKGIPTEVNPDTIPMLITYLDKVISTDFPDRDKDPELYNFVKTLQLHLHTKYCKPTDRSPCRFQFPRKACHRTIIHTYIDIHRMKGKYYETRRSSLAANINAYNPTLLRHFRSNMDIQLVNNAESVAYYICSYICKSEPDDLKNALSNLITNVFQQQSNIPMNRKLWQIGTTVLKHRRISAQEAAFRLSNLKLIQMSMQIVYVNARRPNERFKMLKTMAQIAEMPDESTDVFLSNILDYYRSRPSDLFHYSLYRFVSWYTRASPSTNKHANERIFISDYNLWMKKRKKPCVLRYPGFSVNSEQYFCSMLLLLFPHREESDLLVPFDNAKDAFFHKHHIFDNIADFTHSAFSDAIDTAVRRIQMQEDEIAALNSEQEETQNIDIEHSLFSDLASDDNLVNLNYDDTLTQHVDFNPEDDNYIVHDLASCIMSSKVLRSSIAILTKSQKNVLHMIADKQNNREAFYIFATGPGGVGKSYLIKIVLAYLQHYHSIVPGQSPARVCGPTGVSARNVNGQTIHKLLAIPVRRHLQYEALHPLKIAKLRQYFSGVSTLIIDEISMVGATLLTFISRRLSEITQNDSPFGGLNVLAVGDLFQLRPVRSPYIFQNAMLWHMFTPILLRENIRQSQDTSYARLLNRARVGTLLEEDNKKLKTRLIDPKTTDIPDALHAYPTRKKVHAYNSQRQEQLQQNTQTYQSKHYFSSNDFQPGGEVSEEYIPDDDNDAGGLPRQLVCSIGTRVMLIRNIECDDGLVNGAMGVVTAIDHVHGTISVKFDDETIGKLFDLQTEDTSIQIEEMTHEYLCNGRYVVRQMYPLVPCWATTIHKCQSITLSKLVLDIGSSVFEHGMSYTGLSRVTTLDGLFLVEIDFTKITPHKDVLEENSRLRSLDK